jgi:hypothetical protein
LLPLLLSTALMVILSDLDKLSVVLATLELRSEDRTFDLRSEVNPAISSRR